MRRIASKKLTINYKIMNQLITSKKKKTLKYLSSSKRPKKKETIYSTKQLNSTTRKCWDCKNKNMDPFLTRYHLHTKNSLQCSQKSVISMQHFIIILKPLKSLQIKVNKESIRLEKLLVLFPFQTFT